MPVVLAYVAFVLIGANAGVGGVLLLAQMRDYGVNEATIGITFLTGAAGFVIAGASAGALIHRFGTRVALVMASGGFVLTGLWIAARPSFVIFVVLQLVLGYFIGSMESVLNAYLTTLPNATALLNRLHAFFGVGALLGPILASWIVVIAAWPVVYLVIAVAGVPLAAGFLVTYPKAAPEIPTPGQGGLLGGALRQRGVLLGSALLAVYVGLEVSVGNWGYSFLVEARDQSAMVAGYVVSGYWLGLTLGRFLLGPLLGSDIRRLMTTCMAGVVAAVLLSWLVPAGPVAAVGLFALGFFLGPIFPTAMAVAPQLTTARLVPTAIGVMNAGSVVGGAALPWLAGAVIQGVGVWTLLPFALLIALLQAAVWRPIALRLRKPADQL
jgi:fucose permease